MTPLRKSILMLDYTYILCLVERDNLTLVIKNLVIFFRQHGFALSDDSTNPYKILFKLTVHVNSDLYIVAQ